MKIDKSMIMTKKVVGTRTGNRPVVMVVTHGGLYAFFCKNSKNEVETLGMAPHKAIASWMAEKQARDIKWEDGFSKSEDEVSNLKKSRGNDYLKLREVMFSNVLLKSELDSDQYLIYDTRNITIGVFSKTEIYSMIKTGDIYPESFVRNVNLSEPVSFLSEHGDFYKW